MGTSFVPITILRPGLARSEMLWILAGLSLGTIITGLVLVKTVMLLLFMNPSFFIRFICFVFADTNMSA